MMLRKDLVSVMDKVLMRLFLSEHLSQLLQRPVRGRVRCHVDMSQSARAVLDDNKDVQHPKRQHQKIRQPIRCQRTMVAGRTMTSVSRQSISLVSSARLTRVA